MPSMSIVCDFCDAPDDAAVLIFSQRSKHKGMVHICNACVNKAHTSEELKHAMRSHEPKTSEPTTELNKNKTNNNLIL